jgi:hypothetical protein
VSFSFILISNADILTPREEKKRQRIAAAATGTGGGFMGGLKAGGESVLSGIGSGISGLVTRPVEEGRKSGAVGVIKGVGLGAVGLFTKPVLGISEGVEAIAQGVSSQVGYCLGSYELCAEIL